MSEHPIDQISRDAGVSREEALFYLEGYNWNVDAAMEACITKTLPTASNIARLNPANKMIIPEAIPMVIDTPEKNIGPSISEKKWGQTPDELRHLFCSIAAGTCLDDANAYLHRFDWELQSAINAFFDERRTFKPYPHQKPPEINVSSAMARELIHGGGSMPPLPSLMSPLAPIGPSIRSPSLTLPSQCQALQGIPNLDALHEVKISSSSSSYMDIDKNTSKDPLILVEDNPTSKDKWKGKGIAIDYDPPLKRVEPVRMNLGPRFDQVDTPPLSTIPIKIVLADAAMTEVQIPFRLDQTIGDIRKAIDDLTVQTRGYTLTSRRGIEYTDLTRTVASVVADGYEALYQFMN